MILLSMKTIKYIIFSGPIGSGKTTQMHYLANQNPLLTIVGHPELLKQPNTCLIEGGLPDIYAYQNLADEKQLINDFNDLNQKYGILNIILVPLSFHCCKERIELANKIFKQPINPNGLDKDIFSKALQSYKAFKNNTMHMGTNVEYVNFDINSSILDINKKIVAILGNYLI
jgi:deoxyadenosine/deoxycytidine kinase